MCVLKSHEKCVHRIGSTHVRMLTERWIARIAFLRDRTIDRSSTLARDSRGKNSIFVCWPLLRLCECNSVHEKLARKCWIRRDESRSRCGCAIECFAFRTEFSTQYSRQKSQFLLMFAGESGCVCVCASVFRSNYTNLRAQTAMQVSTWAHHIIETRDRAAGDVNWHLCASQ